MCSIKSMLILVADYTWTVMLHHAVCNECVDIVGFHRLTLGCLYVPLIGCVNNCGDCL
jgi:hypothetical protein